jgi:homoserine dehydrogenase
VYRTNNGLPLWQPLLTGEDEGMANQKKQINIGLLGAGTVGGGVILVLNQNRDLITERVGCPICIKKVLARHPDKVRALDPKTGYHGQDR